MKLLITLENPKIKDGRTKAARAFSNDILEFIFFNYTNYTKYSCYEIKGCYELIEKKTGKKIFEI